MTKYKVKVIHIFNEIIDIEAESEELAIQQVEKKLTSANYDGVPSYETTLPSENWPVITEENYNKLIAEQEKEFSNIITP